MDSPNEKLPFSAPGQRVIDPSASEDSPLLVHSDRLYQIAALAAGLILLVTAF
jgi:hypothetical protein